MEDHPQPEIRVYLVEDQTILRESLGESLSLDQAIEVMGSSRDAEHAIRELDALPVDVVLMDIELPGISGIEATRLLNEKHPDLAVVVLSFDEDEFVEAALEAGAASYLLKSCTRDELLKAIVSAAAGQSPLDSSLVSRLARNLAQLRSSRRDGLLTSRQTEVLKLIAGGMRYKDLSVTLFISPSTVNREVLSIFDRLGVNDAAQAVSEAHKRRLL